MPRHKEELIHMNIDSAQICSITHTQTQKFDVVYSVCTETWSIASVHLVHACQAFILSVFVPLLFLDLPLIYSLFTYDIKTLGKNKFSLYNTGFPVISGFSIRRYKKWMQTKCISINYVYFTVVMVFRAVSAPMLKSDPGTLFETVAGITTIGIHNSSYLSLAWTSSRPPENACVRRKAINELVIYICLDNRWIIS